MTDLFVDKTAAVLTKVLDGTAARQRVLAQNIANIDTPGYTRRNLEFDEELQAAIAQPTADPVEQINRIARVNLTETDDTLSPRQADGNNVDIEHEMVDVAKNSLQYETAAQLLTMQMTLLKNAIHEGRR